MAKPTHPVFRVVPGICALLLATGAAVRAQSGAAPPPTCVENVSLGRGDEAPRVSLVLRDGRIEAVMAADAEVPPGLRRIDGSGLLCLPAFVDAFTRTGCETPEPVIDQDVPVATEADVRVDMRLANRKGIQPAFRVAEALALDDKARSAWREAGFGVVHVGPAANLLGGTSCVATTREAATRDVVVRPEAFATAAFEAQGPGYPSTLMGYMAQLRQFFLDAGWHAERVARHADGRPGLRPPFDAELEAGVRILAGERRLLVDAATHRDVERWMRLADEFGFELAVADGRDAWRVASALAERAVPVVLTLDWGDEVDDPRPKEEDADEERPEDEGEAPAEGAAAGAPEAEAEPAWIYDEPLAVRLERRLDWEERRDNALRLSEAGVPIAFGTGSEKPGTLLERVREAVEAGLPEDTALAALTTGAAELLGIGDRVGRVAAGYGATFALWSADPLTEKKARPRWVFVDGFPTEFEPPKEAAKGDGPADGVDASGTWALVTRMDGDERESVLVIEMTEDGAVTGTLTLTLPGGDGEQVADAEGEVSGTTLRVEVSLPAGDATLRIEFEAELDGDALSGTARVSSPLMPESLSGTVSGTRAPGRAAAVEQELDGHTHPHRRS